MPANVFTPTGATHTHAKLSLRSDSCPGLSIILMWDLMGQKVFLLS